MNYDVIATLGPATSKEDDWHLLREAGASRFRLNTSHLSPEEVETWVERVIAAFRREPMPLVLDLQGSKWRLGAMEPLELQVDQRVVLQIEEELAEGTHRKRPEVCLPVPHEDFFEAAVRGGGVIRLNDARVELQIESVDHDGLEAIVTKGGPLSSRKGISLPGSTYRREGLLPKDGEILRRTAGAQHISYAISYVRDGEELKALSAAIPEGMVTIAKIERPEAVEAARLISQRCDEVWLCRGDLGAEVGGTEMAKRVHHFSRGLAELRAPAILAGQLLEHMTSVPHPTRSELCHLYDILEAGYRGVVLSDETAVGRYPQESCRVAGSFR